MTTESTYIVKIHYAARTKAGCTLVDLRVESKSYDGINLNERASIERANFKMSSVQQGGLLTSASDSLNDSSKVLQKLKHHSEDNPSSHCQTRVTSSDWYTANGNAGCMRDLISAFWHIHHLGI